jgi:hypothetical protein
MPFDTAVHGGGAALVIDQLVSELWVLNIGPSRNC